jgi:hypothetical protein
MSTTGSTSTVDEESQVEQSHENQRLHLDEQFILLLFSCRNEKLRDQIVHSELPSMIN